MKITVMLMIAVAALGAVGVTTAIMSSTTPAYAYSFNLVCHKTNCTKITGSSTTNSPEKGNGAFNNHVHTNPPH